MGGFGLAALFRKRPEFSLGNICLLAACVLALLAPWLYLEQIPLYPVCVCATIVGA